MLLEGRRTPKEAIRRALRLSAGKDVVRIPCFTTFDARDGSSLWSKSQEPLAVQINISTRHGHLSDSTRAKITAKLEKLARLFERLAAIEVTVDLEHADTPSVDVRVSAEHKHDFVATEQAESLMAAVDSVIHKLEQQLRKYKEKVQDHHRTPGARQQQLSAEPEAGGH